MRTVFVLDENEYGDDSISISVPCRLVLRLRDKVFCDNWGKGYWLESGSVLRTAQTGKVVQVVGFIRTTYTLTSDELWLPEVNISGRVIHPAAECFFHGSD